MLKHAFTFYDGHKLKFKSSVTFLKRIYAISFQSKFPHHCTALWPAAVQFSVVLSQSFPRPATIRIS